MGRASTLLLAALVLTAIVEWPAYGQSSADFRLTDHTFNAGGHPHQGVVMVSTSYRITLDALGEGVVGRGLASGLYRMDGSFGTSYPPPGEVHDLRFVDQQTLEWFPDRSAGRYNLYRDLMSLLPGLGYGECFQQELSAATTADGDPLSPGEGYFYLVTVENRLDEEGPKGSDSYGAARQGNVCP
jgi:hypothetical protein